MSVMTRYVGVDPGALGGFACMEQGGSMSWFKPMPDDEDGIEDLLRRLIGRSSTCSNGVTHRVIVCIEKVSGYQGVPRPGNHMFNFGDGNGFIRGYLKAIGYSEKSAIPTLHLVRPQTWQKHHNVIPKKKSEDDRQWKKRLRGYAERAFPSLLVSDKTSDALLIMQYCYDTYGGGK